MISVIWLQVSFRVAVLGVVGAVNDSPLFDTELETVIVAQCIF